LRVFVPAALGTVESDIGDADRAGSPRGGGGGIKPGGPISRGGGGGIEPGGNKPSFGGAGIELNSGGATLGGSGGGAGMPPVPEW